MASFHQERTKEQRLVGGASIRSSKHWQVAGLQLASEEHICYAPWTAGAPLASSHTDETLGAKNSIEGVLAIAWQSNGQISSLDQLLAPSVWHSALHTHSLSLVKRTTHNKAGFDPHPLFDAQAHASS